MMKDEVNQVSNPLFCATVIVPLFNCVDDLEDLLEALSKQQAEGISCEILLVDNGSTDGTFERAVELIQGCSYVRILQESRRGSYAARNKGLSESESEFVCFTDSDCRPCDQWLEAGLSKLRQSEVYVAGGAVEFTFEREKRGAFEVFDAETNMQIERDIHSRQVAKTANLFVRREAFERVGLFDASLCSGGDVAWTANASNAGLGIVYASGAVIRHPARTGWALLRKQVRVGRGKSALRRIGKASPQERNESVIATFARLRRVLEFSGFVGFFKLCFVCVSYQVAGILGRASNILK